MDEIIVKFRLNRHDNKGFSPLLYALQMQIESLSEALIDQGISLYHNQPAYCIIDTLIRKYQWSYIEKIIYNNHIPHHKNILALMLGSAIRHSNERCFRSLFKHVDIDNTEILSETILQYAYNLKFEPAIKYMLTYAQKKTIEQSCPRRPSVLYMAIVNQDLPVVRKCLHAGVSQSHNPKHILHKAIEVDDMNILTLLLKKEHALPWQVMAQHAMEHRKFKSMNRIFKSYQPIDTHNSSILHYLSMSQDTEFLESYLNKYDTEINKTDNDGQSALCVATKHNKVAAVRLLLKHGADPQLCDNSNQSCSYYANQSSNPQMKVAYNDYDEDMTTSYAV